MNRFVYEISSCEDGAFFKRLLEQGLAQKYYLCVVEREWALKQGKLLLDRLRGFSVAANEVQVWPGTEYSGSDRVIFHIFRICESLINTILQTVSTPTGFGRDLGIEDLSLLYPTGEAYFMSTTHEHFCCISVFPQEVESISKDLGVSVELVGENLTDISYLPG